MEWWQPGRAFHDRAGGNASMHLCGAPVLDTHALMDETRRIPRQALAASQTLGML
ncbi:hypothetical protein [Komagataeibacter medellinensis]|uniref:hypothetical protein n=1 Tax=Komagataeibacter medellinensis TaxID=1177712 RepID=UPI0012960A8C|nr:hypothetical protein [Komagataeibacter medellinensis]